MADPPSSNNTSTSRFFSDFHHWNARLCVPVGLMFNCLMAWLVLRKTPKQMRVHSRILLQNCALDMCILLLVLTIGIPVIVMPGDQLKQQQEGGSLFVLYDGYLTPLFHWAFGGGGLFWHMLVFWFCIYLDITGICAQFVYRYILLNRNGQITITNYLLMLLPCLGISLTTSILQQRSTLLQPLNIGELLSEHYIKLNYDFGLSACIFYGLIDVLAYLTIAFCGFKMVRYVSAQAADNARLRMLNRQLTMNLLILASLPLLMITLDFVTILDLAHFVQLTPTVVAPAEDLVLTFLAAWAPALNPLVGILVNKPYRDAVLLFACRKRHANGNPNVQVVPANAAGTKDAGLAATNS